MALHVCFDGQGDRRQIETSQRKASFAHAQSDDFFLARWGGGYFITVLYLNTTITTRLGEDSEKTDSTNSDMHLSKTANITFNVPLYTIQILINLS